MQIFNQSSCPTLTMRGCHYAKFSACATVIYFIHIMTEVLKYLIETKSSFSIYLFLISA